MSRILVVDDKELMRDSVATTLVRKGHTVVAASGGVVAMEKLGRRAFDVVVTDLQMPEMTGLELLEQIRAIDEQLPVIFMTAFGTVESAVVAMKQGAFDYITKPFSGDELVITVDRALEHGRLIKENQILKASTTPASGKSETNRQEFIGTAPSMQQFRDQLKQIAESHSTVLITGESGTGKEVAARWLHQHSPRADMPFLAVNCAALSTSLLESELFGHEKGAFTGADKLRKGRFELADGGTLLLDEISEITPEIQAKLLRVLQEQTFERVGSSQSRPVDVRIIATTNRNLSVQIENGAFRQDLFFRLNVLPMVVPPLRDRQQDISELANYFLTKVAEREGKPVKKISPETVTLFSTYAWPGNVRELQNVCERAAVLTVGDVITAELMQPWLDGCGSIVATQPTTMIEVGPGVGDVRPSVCPSVICGNGISLGDLERVSIVATLKYYSGHRQRSAKALGIGVRTLGLKLKKWKEQQIVACDL